MKDQETPYTPFGFHFETEEDVQAQEARDTHIAYEFRADFRKAEGSERDYQSEDNRAHQTHHITDGLSEAILLGLSPSWLQEESDWTDSYVSSGQWSKPKHASDWEYWVENHHALAICSICHMVTSEIGCTDCNKAIATPKGDGDCFPNVCSIIKGKEEACKFHAGELPSKREERMLINSQGQFVTL